jgi:hypothetical protein
VKVKEYSSDWVELNVMANMRFGSDLVYILLVCNGDEDQEILLRTRNTFFY